MNEGSQLLQRISNLKNHEIAAGSRNKCQKIFVFLWDTSPGSMACSPRIGTHSSPHSHAELEALRRWELICNRDSAAKNSAIWMVVFYWRKDINTVGLARPCAHCTHKLIQIARYHNQRSGKGFFLRFTINKGISPWIDIVNNPEDLEDYNGIPPSVSSGGMPHTKNIYNLPWMCMLRANAKKIADGSKKIERRPMPGAPGGWCGNAKWIVIVAGADKKRLRGDCVHDDVWPAGTAAVMAIKIDKVTVADKRCNLHIGRVIMIKNPILCRGFPGIRKPN